MVFRALKSATLIIALALTIQAQSAKEGKRITKWTLVAEGEMIKSYFAPETIRRADDVIKVWAKFELPYGSSHLLPETDFGIVRAYIVLDCARTLMSMPTMIVYDRNGKHVDEKEKVEGEGNTSWEEPNNMAHVIIQYFCERPAPKPTKAPALIKPS
jgi:hypothetical protein